MCSLKIEERNLSFLIGSKNPRDAVDCTLDPDVARITEPDQPLLWKLLGNVITDTDV